MDNVPFETKLMEHPVQHFQFYTKVIILEPVD